MNAAGQISAWVHTPVGQRACGSWVDSLLPPRGRAHHAPPAGGVRERIERIRAVDAQSAVNELFLARGWTDGLPVVAPTVDRVRDMLRFSRASAQTALAPLAPMQGLATVEKVAINAVMAGCRPEYLPVVLAAVRALASPAFNLRGVQSTDENVAPLLIVSGPIVQQLGINDGIGALGPGVQANATIGRALRLVMINIGGGRLGDTVLAGIGQPARYTLCVGENQAASPWPGLHVEAGLPSQTSALTLLRAECCINITGELDDIASVMGSAVSAFNSLHGGCVAVLLAPATVARLTADGWGKADIAQYLYENGRIPAATWRRMWVARKIIPDYGAPAWVQAAAASGEAIPVVASARDIVLFVAGGSAPIAQHVYFPGWGFPYCRVVEPIELPHDWSRLVGSPQVCAPEHL